MNPEFRIGRPRQEGVNVWSSQERAPPRTWGLANRQSLYQTRRSGGVAEWLNAAVLKTVEPSRAPGVRIPPPPPLFHTGKSPKTPNTMVFICDLLRPLAYIETCSTIQLAAHFSAPRGGNLCRSSSVVTVTSSDDGSRAAMGALSRGTRSGSACTPIQRLLPAARLTGSEAS